MCPTGSNGQVSCKIRDAVSRALDRVAAGLQFDLPMPADELATVLLDLSHGLAVETAIDPDGVPDDLLGRVLTLIAGDAMDEIRAAAVLPAGRSGSP